MADTASKTIHIKAAGIGELKRFWEELSMERRKAFLKKAKVSENVIRWAFGRYRNVSPEATKRIEMASGGQVTKEMLRPDIYGSSRDDSSIQLPVDLRDEIREAADRSEMTVSEWVGRVVRGVLEGKSPAQTNLVDLLLERAGDSEMLVEDFLEADDRHRAEIDKLRRCRERKRKKQREEHGMGILWVEGKKK